MAWNDQWTWERALKVAQRAYENWENNPVIARWLAAEAAAAQAIADARIAAAIASLRTSSVVAAAGSLSVTLVVPLAVWVGVFAALGAPYAEARELVKSENFKSGFTQGFIIGLLGWEWHQATSRFFKFSPDQTNGWDPGMGYVSANAYNEGLRSGYIHGSGFDEEARKSALKELRTLSPTTSKGDWDRRAQITYVIELAAAGIKGGMFKSG